MPGVQQVLKGVRMPDIGIRSFDVDTIAYRHRGIEAYRHRGPKIGRSRACAECETALPSTGLLRRTLVDVVGADDVVLAEIGADLHLDQLEGDLARVLQAVLAAQRQVGALVL